MRMTNQDYLRLANGAASLSKATPKGFYDQVNADLLARFNKGANAFSERLNKMIKAQATTSVCPWAHVGKNH